MNVQRPSVRFALHAWLPATSVCAGRYFVRCFVFTPLVFTGALFPALGRESGFPEEAKEQGKRWEQELWPLWKAAKRQRRDALLSLPCKLIRHLLTAPSAFQDDRLKIELVFKVTVIGKFSYSLLALGSTWEFSVFHYLAVFCSNTGCVHSKL